MVGSGITPILLDVQDAMPSVTQDLAVRLGVTYQAAYNRLRKLTMSVETRGHLVDICDARIAALETLRAQLLAAPATAPAPRKSYLATRQLSAYCNTFAPGWPLKHGFPAGFVERMRAQGFEHDGQGFYVNKVETVAR